MAKTYTYRGHKIEPKRDFGSGKGHLIDGKWVKKGWVVVKSNCNVMPGACWFQTIKEAKHGIDVLIQVGGEKNSGAFWDIMHPFDYEVGKLAPDHTKGHASTVTKGKHWAVVGEDGIVKRVGHDGKPPNVWA